MLTVISWYGARRAHRELHPIVAGELSDRPTLLAVVSDLYTNETNLRPFAPLAERFGERLHVILAAEWPQADREREGEVLLGALGVSPEARLRLLRDEGVSRCALVLRRKRPVALVELFFKERRRAEDAADAQLAALEDEAFRKLDELIVRLPPQPPPAPRALQPGDHDWAPSGLCRLCGEGRGALLACAGTLRGGSPSGGEEPRRDRFELIELD